MRTHRVEFVGSFPTDPPVTGRTEIAFGGRSNVGKSSAINRLLGVKKAARVSARPGRTQALNLFNVDDAFTFIDLPGYGYAKVPKAMRQAWGQQVESFLRDRETLKLVVLLVDIRHGAQQMDHQLLAALQKLDVPRLVLATKADKLSRNQRGKALKVLKKGLDISEIEPFSAVNGEGVDQTWRRFHALTP